MVHDHGGHRQAPQPAEPRGSLAEVGDDQPGTALGEFWNLGTGERRLGEFKMDGGRGPHALCGGKRDGHRNVWPVAGVVGHGLQQPAGQAGRGLGALGQRQEHSGHQIAERGMAPDRDGARRPQPTVREVHDR
jgi:hypothetical protein